MHSETATQRPVIWISAAETSADLHGAELIRELGKMIPNARFVGMGGPAMRDEPFEAVFRSEDLSVMGLTEVIEFLPRILSILRGTKKHLSRIRPDVVVVIDSPDFHFRVAKMAKKLGLPLVYYIAPQVWAWRKGRVKFMRRAVDKLLCIIPFEERFFLKHHVPVEFVGHPFMEHIDFDRLDSVPVDSNHVTLLPGSRSKEVKALLPRFAEAARIMRSQRPGLTFSLIRAPHIDEALIQDLWPQDIPLAIIPSKDRYEELSRSVMALASSGTATLECALLGVPTLVAYIVSPLSYLIGRMLVDVPFISMPNLILGKGVYPEFIQHQVTGDNLAGHALEWLQSPDALDRVRRALKKLPSLMGAGGASKNAARCVAEILEQATTAHT